MQTADERCGREDTDSSRSPRAVAPPGATPSKRAVLAAVGRRCLPHLVEASIIPTALFYALLGPAGLHWSLIATLVWAYVAVGRRLVTGREIPALVLMASVGITVRTAIFLCNGSTFIYFVQPILGTLVTSVILASSVAYGRPLVARFASDFCPLAPDLKQRPEVVRLFRRLTFLWAGVNLAAAMASLALLLTVPINVFVGTRIVAAWTISAAGIGLTIADSLRTARRTGLAAAVTSSPGAAWLVAQPA